MTPGVKLDNIRIEGRIIVKGTDILVPVTIDLIDQLDFVRVFVTNRNTGVMLRTLLLNRAGDIENLFSGKAMEKFLREMELIS